MRRSNVDGQKKRGEKDFRARSSCKTLKERMFLHDRSLANSGNSPECRRRKVKCDEKQPRCGQCERRDGNCHLKDSIFKQHVFSPVEVSHADATQSPNVELNSQPDDPVFGLPTSLEQQSNITASDELPPLQPNSTSNTSRPHTLPPPSALPGSLFSTAPITGLRHSGNLLFEHQYGNISTTSRSEAPLSEQGPWQHHEPTVESLKDTQQELFLLRHYSECIAPWMDLLYRYEVFSREVLTLAREHSILRYAACAVAAKQLGQMKHPIPALCGKIQQDIATQCFRGRSGFIWYGIKYYEKAIRTLVKSITPKDQQATDIAQTQTSDDHASPTISLSQGDLMVRAEGEDPIVRLLGTCILIQYEALSANLRRLLLDLIDAGQLLNHHPIFEQVYPWTKSIMEVKAGFWNFVANDLEQSFVAHHQTRVDTENLALWRNMGLLIEDDGSLSLFDGQYSLSTTPEHARDKVLSYTLIRLLCKLIDYVAPILPLGQLPTQGSPSSVNPTRDRFVHLESQFDNWYRILSPSFHPDGKFSALREDPKASGGPGLFNSALWFSNDPCSTTMMYYHMARMLLITHRPVGLLSGDHNQDNTLPVDLLSTFREMEKGLKVHASEVIAIIRGNPCDAVKLRSIQPLYLAGRSCTTRSDQRILLDMFRDIQNGLGVATGYRVEALLQEWGTSYEELEAQPLSASEDHHVPQQ
ncbi:unnamed protein product [Clonostachys chloroleuca]|uniref:Zn(2)-C6 fungal-type domain-containing protein n=1 Tax=Clonostachys chloroleuca TaxID=1926264 RepID=A0AA35LR67_9HYPO|nr:unnamed protein product [Clonostachys chloroleuca]